MNDYHNEKKPSLSYFESLITYGISSLQGQRSIFGLYHIIQGKRSSQTIQDGHLFHLLPFFSLLPQLKKHELEEVVMHLYEQKFIQEFEKQVFVVTKKGQNAIAHYKIQSLLSLFDGWGLKDIAKVFSLRLRLFIQSLSQLAIGNNKFIPMVKDHTIQGWVQRTFPPAHRRDQVRQRLFWELYNFLQDARPLDREIFIGKLSGAHRYGYTNEQLSIVHTLSVIDVELCYQALIHQLIKKAMKYPNDFQIIFKFLEQEKQRTLLTSSAEKTLEMYKRGASIDEIATRRRLKLSTIEDHLVEAFFYDSSLRLRDFVSETDELAIIYAMKEYGKGKLRKIKEHLPEQISYFQIRLVLAKEGKKQ